VRRGHQGELIESALSITVLTVVQERRLQCAFPCEKIEEGEDEAYGSELR
jgi:hypothetical protein